MEWIDIKEQKPPPGCIQYLVRTLEIKANKKRYSNELAWWGAGGFGSVDERKAVLFWAHLPQPPGQE